MSDAAGFAEEGSSAIALPQVRGDAATASIHRRGGWRGVGI
jgi:hypothetical protein